MNERTDPKEVTLNRLIEAIEDYLNQKETDYALLLKGPWGCGKTYFFKNEVSDLLKRSFSDKLASIYVSLYGIDKSEDISRRLFFAQHPVFDSKVARKLAACAKSISNFSLGGFSFGGKSWTFDPETWIKLGKDCLLCFDDLERCKMKLDSVLGYINRFVEHDHIKTIIIANEEKIPNDQKAGYDEMKEKVIGRTFEVEVDFGPIVHSFIATANDDLGFNAFLKSHEELILRIVKNSGIKNIRILKHGIDYYYRIYQYLHSHQNLFENYASKLLLFTLSICYEIMGGSTEKKILQSITSGEDFMLNLQLRSLEKNEKDYLQTFYDKYVSENQDMFYFSQGVLKYVESGYFDENMLNNEMQENVPQPQHPDVTLRKSILDGYYQLSDVEFKVNTKELLRQIVKGTVPVSLYYRLFEYYEYFSNRKMILEDKATLLRKFTTGVLRATKISGYATSGSRFPDIDLDKRSEEYRTFAKLVDDIVGKSKEVQQRKQYKELFELLPGDFKKFQTLLTDDREGFRLCPAFAHFNLRGLGNRVLKLNNDDLHGFVGLIRSRYKSIGNIESFLGEERDDLLKLKAIIKASTRDKKRRLKDGLLELLVKEIDDAAVILNKGKTEV